MNSTFALAARSLVQILGEMHVSQVSLVYDDDTQWMALKESVQLELPPNHIQILHTLKYSSVMSDAELDLLFLRLKARRACKYNAGKMYRAPDKVHNFVL